MINALIQKKRTLLPAGTDVFRVLDGEGDGVPDVFIDRLGDRWLVSVRDREIPPALAKELEAMGEPVYLKRLDRDHKEAPVLIFGETEPSRFIVHEQGVRLWLDVSAGYSQGLFLDQRDNRRRVSEWVSPGDRVLNTFSYTGAFSVYAALAGAVTTTLDLAQPCLDWTRENMLLNSVAPESQFFCKGDTLHWLERFSRQGKTFKGIVLDPPTFSRDKRGRIWRVETDYGKLAALAYACLAPGGWMLCTTNCRKVSPEDFERQIRLSLPGHVSCASFGMPFDFTGEPYLKTLWVRNGV